MKKLVFLLLAILVLLGVYVALMNMHQKKIIALLVEKKGDKIGALHYRLYMLGLIPVGEAYINKEVQEDFEGKNVYHLSASARTNRLLAPFFLAEADVDSFVDMASINPLVFRQRLFVKNKYDQKKEARYDQDKGIMTSGGVSRVIPPDTKDPLSAMLYLKRLSNSMLKDFEINLNTNQKTYVLKGVSDIKEVSIGQEKYQTVDLTAQIMRRDKNPYHKSTISMLLVRAKENIPVKISVFSGGFFLQAVLADIK